MQYKEDRNKCIVQGPIAKPRNIQDETTFTVASDDVIFRLGTPIVCHGFDASHYLNGRIGDLRSWSIDTGFYQVHFEDEALPSGLLHRANIRILFELPSRE